LAEFTVISEVHDTRATINELYDFLIDFKNFQSILPADKVENFQFTEDSCSFNVKGVTFLSIKRISSTPYSSVKFQSEGATKFSFILEVKLSGETGNKGRCHVELWADTAPFIKILAEKPLGKLINTMAQKLGELEINKS
jgi:hypothetical protein